MALHTLTDDGHLGWICHHCAQDHTVHVSHEQVEHPYYDEVEVVEVDTSYTDAEGKVHTKATTRKTGKKILHRGIIALPLCDCGTRTFLKAAFTDAELAASNMIDKNGNPTESHAIAHRHMALARHMEALGKAGQ